MNLETERLLLRRWRESDKPTMREMNSDPRVMEFFPEMPTPEQSDTFVDRINAHFDQHGFGLWAAELRATGECTGWIGLNVPTFEAHFVPCVEIGWRLKAEHWGRGLATEGAREVLRFAFEDQGLEEIVAFTVPDNLRSQRVMDKLGMTRDPHGDFDRPGIPPNHRFRRHSLWRLTRANWATGAPGGLRDSGS